MAASPPLPVRKPLRRQQHAPKGPTPASLGFRMPAEWEPQESVWLAWPHDPVTWPDRLEIVEQVYMAMIRELARKQWVDLLVDPGEEERKAARLLDGDLHLRLHPVQHADSWVRDYGPTFLLRDAQAPARGGDAAPREGGQTRERAYVDWIFNAWGDKYETLLPDDAIGAALEPRLGGARRFEPGIVMEGGAIDVNGQGLVLTTEQCLLNPNRNPHLSRAEVERYLCDYLGARKVLWLGDGIAGDDTDGHVDDIARFAGPRTVLAAVEEDVEHPNHAPLRDNLKRLRNMTDLQGKPLEVVEMPMPRDVLDDDGEPLPASYLNFLIANEVVLLPVFDDPADDAAERILSRVFPGRRVVSLPARDLVYGMGTVHCLSQQMPAA